ncbi:methionine adenosyltransferase [Serinibacter salmoneus]|uniref:S-adenosylmethionine synthase n=1 Tax=Serinibacter salmoneus TaxID=556530 RepID=A0A2A9CZU1_9MICO|nr:methionine adenosyltransferase [Serinibacter salmoneus]PFG19651.1 methionine adenosyltransferase [Serinibacter salmoneus]
MTSLRSFTSESVTEGHPDKVSDLISDSILDALLRVDSHSRVAVETLVTTGLVHVAGEINSRGYVEMPALVRDVITGIGYTSSEVSFDGNSCGVSLSIGQQSPEIEQGLTSSREKREGEAIDPYDAQGAGDQGLMFGYATDETPTLMPLPVHLAHRLSERLTHVRKAGIVANLRPDGKTQVTIGYDGDRPAAVQTVVISAQHAPALSEEELREALHREVLVPVLAEHVPHGVDTSGVRLLVNPTGAFTLGGPMGDAGLTGRKIIVDTYGGMSRHGGGAFSGKDPSKVDRSAAYATRWVAKNVVAAGLARRCEVQVAYAIGQAHPVGVYVETFGTQAPGVTPEGIAAAIDEVFDLRPAAIIADLDLIRPIYALTSNYGHFGRELPEFTWERTDRVPALRAAAGLD